MAGLFQQLARSRFERARRQALDDGLVHEAARAELFGDIKAALLEDPTRDVLAPKGRAWTGVDVVLDDSAGKDSTLLADLIGCVARLAKAGDEQALALIDGVAERFADFHCDDLARERAGEVVADDDFDPEA